MRELLIATGNKGKISGLVAGLEGLPFALVNLHDRGDLKPVEEPAETFEGNAIIKAMTYGMRTGLLTLADDSGLEIDALQGLPGVRSARYVPGTDEDRCRKILEEMNGVPDDQRIARYKCVISVFDPATEKVFVSKGECAGRIAHESRGTNGFGYDPILFSDDLQKHYAEGTIDEWRHVSHRARALKNMKIQLQKHFV